MPHSPEKKAQALALLADQSKSYAEIRDICQVPVGTLAGWAKGAGIARPGAQKGTEAATKARAARIAERRERLREKLLRSADVFVDRAVGIAKSQKPRDAQALMTAAAIAFDKFRLEMGEATQVTEQRDAPVSKAREKVDELAKRRERKTA